MPLQRPQIVLFGQFALVITCLALNGAASASNPLDLQQAYSLARQAEPNYLAAQAAANEAREFEPQAYAQFLPNIQLSGNQGWADTTQTDILGQQINSASYNYDSHAYNLTVRQPLIRSQSWANYAQASARVEGAEADLQAALKTLGQQVISEYFNLLFSIDVQRLLEAEKSATASLLTAARRSFEQGRGTRNDIDEAQANYDMILAQEIEATQNILMAKRKLSALVGESVDQVLPLNPEKMVLSQPDHPDLAYWQGQANSNSPQILSLSAAVDSARHLRRKAAAAHQPTLDAVYQKSDTLSDGDSNINRRNKTDRVSLQLTIPLFTGGYDVSVQRQAVANEEKTRQKLEAARRSLAIEVQKQYQIIVQGGERIRALVTAQQSASQMVISTEKGVLAGTRTRLDVLEARRKAALVERNLAQARYSFVLAKFQLSSMAGEEDLEVIERINRWLDF